MTCTYQMQSAFINKCHSFSILCSLFAYQLALMLCGFTLSQQYPREAGFTAHPDNTRLGPFSVLFCKKKTQMLCNRRHPKGIQVFTSSPASLQNKRSKIRLAIIKFCYLCHQIQWSPDTITTPVKQYNKKSTVSVC